MNQQQKEVIEELKQEAKKIGHTPKQRDISNNLLWRCHKHFKYFNNAKKLAGLPIVNVRRIDFSQKSFKLDKDMAHIASYLTFDGHLYKDLKAMMFASKNIEDLKGVERIFNRKFEIQGKYHLNSAGIQKKVHQFYIFNKKIASELYALGIPKGEKVMQNFSVPNWIKDSKELSREYLKIAFLCEGSFCEKDRKNSRIQINTAKGEEFLDSGLKFMEDLRCMLSKFDIRTTNSNIMGENQIRKTDGKRTKNVRFRIITEDNHKFIKEIGWIK